MRKGDIVGIPHSFFMSFHQFITLSNISVRSQLEKKVQVGKDQEKAQSEKDSHFKNS